MKKKTFFLLKLILCWYFFYCLHIFLLCKLFVLACYSLKDRTQFSIWCQLGILVESTISSSVLMKNFASLPFSDLPRSSQGILLFCSIFPSFFKIFQHFNAYQACIFHCFLWGHQKTFFSLQYFHLEFGYLIIGNYFVLNSERCFILIKGFSINLFLVIWISE